MKWLDRIQRALHEQGTSYTPGDGGPIDLIYKAINALHGLKRESSSPNVLVSPHFQVNSQWIENALEEHTILIPWVMSISVLQSKKKNARIRVGNK